ncbi:hypothetical protein ACLKA6_000516 [Drosophila palustris]
MENDDYQPLLRRRRNRHLKWTESQVLESLERVLDLVKDVPESLEKPTAQKFYAKVMESSATDEQNPVDRSGHRNKIPSSEQYCQLRKISQWTHRKAFWL